MTHPMRTTIRESLTNVHFGDGPPYWNLNAGKPWARPCDMLSEAVAYRNVVARKLEWHGREHGEEMYSALERVLRSCCPKQRCFSGGCPICTRALQRWFVIRGLSFSKRLHREVGQEFRILSAVPDFGQVRPKSLLQFDWPSFQERARRALRRAGIKRFVAGIDVSLNHWDGFPEDALFQFQLWALLEDPRGPWLKRLKSEINRSGKVVRPVRYFAPRRPRASLAYGIKDNFNRRVSYIEDNSHREHRRACRNTRDRPLKGERWAELMVFLDGIGLDGRVIACGI